MQAQTGRASAYLRAHSLTPTHTDPRVEQLQVQRTVHLRRHLTERMFVFVERRYELESLRRSIAMLRVGAPALDREAAIVLVRELQALEGQIRRAAGRDAAPTRRSRQMRRERKGSVCGAIAFDYLRRLETWLGLGQPIGDLINKPSIAHPYAASLCGAPCSRENAGQVDPSVWSL